MTRTLHDRLNVKVPSPQVESVPPEPLRAQPEPQVAQPEAPVAPLEPQAASGAANRVSPANMIGGA